MNRKERRENREKLEIALQLFLEEGWEKIGDLWKVLPIKKRWQIIRQDKGLSVRAIWGDKNAFDRWAENMAGEYNNSNYHTRKMSVSDAKAEILGLVLWEVLTAKGLVKLRENGRDWDVDEGVVNLYQSIGVLQSFVPWRHGVNLNQVNPEILISARNEINLLRLERS